MNKKRVFIFFLLAFLFSASFVLAEENATTANLTGFDKSYDCLKTKIDAVGYASMTPEELGFSLLALAYDKDRQDALKDQLESLADVSTPDQKCWPSGACTLKETSIMLLAYNYIGADTSEIESWLLNHTLVASDLVWYLEIDTDEKAECSLTYDNNTKKITVNEDKTISGTPGACFRLAQNNYWLEVVSSCYDKDIEIVCDKDFLTTSIYRGKNQNIIFVSDLTNRAAPGGKTMEKIQSLCFTQGGTCNYEGSLWAALALNKENSKNTKLYLPYLMTFASTNSRSLPYAFLYSLTGFDEYFSELSASQNSLGYWQISDTSRRYYDTALALMALHGKLTEQESLAVDYLLTPSVQQDGCWQNSLRDTAFILYAAYPKPAAKGMSTIIERTDCEDISGYSCISTVECEDLNGTDVSQNFYCPGGAICCDKETAEPSCSEKGGVICSSTEDCTGTMTLAEGTSRCCIDGICEIKAPEVNECEEAGYFCRVSSCLDDEEELTTISCPEFALCCVPKPESRGSYWWIWLLIILIILIILAIILRDQLKVWWFKIKGKVSKTPAPTQQRPPVPPMGARRIIPGQVPAAKPMPPGKPFPKEAELKSTLDRLKEMSK